MEVVNDYVFQTSAGSGLLFLDEQLSKMWAELSGGECSFSTKQRILHLLVWVSKALLMQGHPSGMDTATKVPLASIQWS